MKAEHRKELETNVLAQHISRAIEGLKQGPSKTTLYWVGGAVAIVVIVWLFYYFLSSSKASTSERWRELDEAVFPEQYSSFLEGELKDTPQGRQARFKEAAYDLDQGLLDPKSPEAQEKIVKATEIYVDLARSVAREPILHQEALMGAARGFEAQGDIDQARTYYEQLVNEHPKSALGEKAKKSLERLDDKDNRATLAELKKAFSSRGRGKE
jgi:hypothetical protein